MSKEAMKQALEALEDCYSAGDYNEYQFYDEDLVIAAKEALREALAEQPAQQCRTDGRCQYAIDSGAEGMGHCPKGKCVMPAQHEPVAWEQFYPEMGKPKLAYLPPTESPENACYAPPAQQEPVAWCSQCGHKCPQPAPIQQEPVAWVDLIKEADEIVRGKVLWKRFIDGTPLANDIACWMADFAQRYTSPPAQRSWVGLTDEEILEFARAIEATLRSKNT